MTDGGEVGPGARPRPLVQKIIAGLLFAMLLGVVPAMLFSVHLPSDLAVRVAQWTAVVVGTLAAWESRDGGAIGKVAGRSSWLTAHPITRVPLMALFAFFMTFTVIEDGVLALVTTIAGHPGHRDLTVTGVSRPRRQCDHFDVQEVRWLLNRALCGSEDDLARAENGGQLTVYGQASPFGLNVERYELRTGRRYGERIRSPG